MTAEERFERPVDDLLAVDGVTPPTPASALDWPTLAGEALTRAGGSR